MELKIEFCQILGHDPSRAPLDCQIGIFEKNLISPVKMVSN